MSGKFYGHSDCEAIARRVWRGSFPKANRSKWCDTNDVGINFATDYLMISSTWQQVTEALEMKIEKVDIGIGRIYVRRIQ